jgi:hypothetical protein
MNSATKRQKIPLRSEAAAGGAGALPDGPALAGSSDHAPGSQLANEHRVQLLAWLTAGLPFYLVQELAAKQCQLQLTHEDLERLWKSEVAPCLLERRARVAQMVVALAEAAPPVPYDQVIADQVRQQLFELLCDPNAEVVKLKVFLAHFLKLQEGQLKERKLQLELQKYQDTVTAVQEKLGRKPSPPGEFTEAERQAILDKMDELLGLRPLPKPVAPPPMPITPADEIMLD